MKIRTDASEIINPFFFVFFFLLCGQKLTDFSIKFLFWGKVDWAPGGKLGGGGK